MKCKLKYVNVGVLLASIGCYTISLYAANHCSNMEAHPCHTAASSHKTDATCIGFTRAESSASYDVCRGYKGSGFEGCSDASTVKCEWTVSITYDEGSPCTDSSFTQYLNETDSISVRGETCGPS